MITKRFRRRQRGFTVVELVTGAGVLTLVLLMGVNIMAMAYRSVHQGMQNATIENDTQYSIRYIAHRLREAAAVTVDSDGLGISFYAPAKDGNGNYVTPLTPSSVEHRFYYSDGKIYERLGDRTPKAVVDYAMNSDPTTGQSGSSFRIFRASSSGVVRMITVLLVARRSTPSGYVTARVREAVYLRNIPSVTR